MIANLSPLSPTKTFNTSLSTLTVRTEFSDASRLHCSNKRTSSIIVKVFTYLISVHVRLPESRVTITTMRHDTIDARSTRSACVHPAIVNISAVMDGGLRIGFAVCFKRGLVFTRRTTCITSTNTISRWLNALAQQQPALPLPLQCCCNIGVDSAVEPPTAFPRGVWVLAWTHPCDDPPRQDGEPSKRQLVLGCECLCRCLALWSSCER